MQVKVIHIYITQTKNALSIFIPININTRRISIQRTNENVDKYIENQSVWEGKK